MVFIQSALFLWFEGRWSWSRKNASFEWNEICLDSRDCHARRQTQQSSFRWRNSQRNFITIMRTVFSKRKGEKLVNYGGLWAAMSGRVGRLKGFLPHVLCQPICCHKYADRKMKVFCTVHRCNRICRFLIEYSRWISCLGGNVFRAAKIQNPIRDYIEGTDFSYQACLLKLDGHCLSASI